MTRTLAGLLAAILWATPAAAQPPESRPFNRNLGWGGVLTVMVGAALMVPYKEPGATDVRVYGHDQCVIDNPTGYPPRYEIQNHACRTTPPLIKAGLITMGAGGLMMLVGFHRVKVAPVLGPAVVGASASVQW